MTNQDSGNLENTIKAVAEKARRFKGRGMGEQNTKASLVEPILEALGWDIRDPDEVHREFKPVPRDSPVDYALKIIRKPRLFVEAKGLDENLSDRKWIAQVLGYAIVAGVEWCVLTDGDEFRFYNATAPIDAEEKLFCRLRLSEANAADAAKTLLLISRSNMEENHLDVLWAEHFVDRQVRETFRGLIESADKRLVRLIRSVARKLTRKEVAESIRRLVIRIDPPATLPDAARAGDIAAAITSSISPDGGKESSSSLHTRRKINSKAIESVGDKLKQRKERTHIHIGVRLAEIVQAGMLNTPLKLFRSYKGTNLKADLTADGTIEFQGELYSRCSAAAEAARMTVTGRRMTTNGWKFWQYVDADGTTSTLEESRRKFLARDQK